MTKMHSTVSSSHINIFKCNVSILLPVYSYICRLYIAILNHERSLGIDHIYFQRFAIQIYLFGGSDRKVSVHFQTFPKSDIGNGRV